MAGTYSQIIIHIVFTVNNRDCLLKKAWRKDVFKYMSGVITKQNHKALIVNGVSDHVHILIGLNPSASLSDLVRDVKSCSSKYINDRKLVKGRFQWQSGYGAFSHARSHVPSVYNYIESQEKHHEKQSFKGEYIGMLNKNGVSFKEEYLMDFVLGESE